MNGLPILHPVTPPTLSILVDPEPITVSPDVDRAAEARWAAMRARNPRYFDGPILGVRDIDRIQDAARTGRIRAGLARYRLLAVQDAPPEDQGPGEDAVPTGVTLLSVNGVVMTAGDEPRVLVGKRSPSVRNYPGQWEIGPSGGLDPVALGLWNGPSTEPSGLPRELGLDAVRRQLTLELEEETGLRLNASAARTIGLLHDPVARSLDVVLRLDVPASAAMLPPRHADQWEYTDALWLGRSQVGRFLTREGARVSPPMHALLVALGWAHS